MFRRPYIHIYQGQFYFGLTFLCTTLLVEMGRGGFIGLETFEITVVTEVLSPKTTIIEKKQTYSNPEIY